MKLVEDQKLAANKPGSVSIIPEEPGDLSPISKLMEPGDTVAADTTRKVVRYDKSGNAKDTVRVRVHLKIQITAVDYQNGSSCIHVRGKNMIASEHVLFGASHTVDIEKNKKFALGKDVWTAEEIAALHEGCKLSGADLAVILMRRGSAEVYLVAKKDANATLCAKIEGHQGNNNDNNNNNKKKGINNNKKDHQSKFFETLFTSIVEHVDFSETSGVVLASPGSIKDEFRTYLLAEARKLKLRSIEDNKSRIVMVTTEDETSLKQVLQADEVMKSTKDAKSTVEIRAFKDFSDRLRVDSDRACYGPKHVEIAQEFMAIETLFIIDDLFKHKETATRQTYEELVRSVKQAGGKAFVFSSKNVSGEKLSQLTGIAATLRFPIPNLDDMVL